MNVRPFRLLGATALNALDDKANDAIRGWVDAWFAAPLPPSATDGVRVRTTTPSDFEGATEDHWWRIIGPHPHWLGLHIPTGARRAIAERLHGFQSGPLPDRSSSLSQQLLNRVFLDLGQRLLTAYGVTLESGVARIVQQTPVPSVWQRGSGAVVAEMQSGGEKVILLLPPELTVKPLSENQPRQGAPLAARGDSLDSQAVRLRAWVGTAELRLDAMQGLRVGDVIRLDCGIDQPLRLLLDVPGREERPLARGYLGTAQGHQAVQLVKDS